MFKKKRRMELARPGERRRREERQRESEPITRRVFLFRGAMGVGFAGLGAKLWSLQIAEGSKFEEAASDNITRSETLKASRGRILDRSGIPLAENRRIWAVTIMGNQLPLDEAERQRVLDTVAESLELKNVLVLDRTLVPVGSEAAVVNLCSQRLGVDSATLLAKITSKDAYLEPLKEDLDDAQAEELKASLSDIPGIRVLSELNYALETHGSPELPMVVKQDITREKALELASNVVYLPGVVVDDTTLIRQYSGGSAFSHLLGYVGPISEQEYEQETTSTGGHIYQSDDNVGRGGVEEALEKYMRGEKGIRWVQVDSVGIERLELTDLRRDPTDGLSARLTIDRELQLRVTQELKNGIDFANAEALKEQREKVGAGVAIVMNPKNGEILAMVSWPTFDNQKFIGGISEADYNALLNDEFTPLLNRAISGEYPPGSVLKPLLACAALEANVITPKDTFKCMGSIRVPWTWDESQGNTYPCWDPAGHGDVDLFSGLADSCDVYFYNVGAPKSQTDAGINVHYYNPNDPTPHEFRGLGIENIEKYLKEVFGFGTMTGIELAGEAEGLVPNPKWLFQSDLHEYWSIGDTINVSIGQGHLLCTPLQLLNGTAAIANGGTLYIPRLIRDLVDEHGTVVERFPAKKLRELQIDKQHINDVREGMRRTVTEGTGMGKININDVEVGAKSGTAEYGEAVDGKYKKSHAWFTAFAPYNNPEICVAVMIQGGGAGSTYAGPVTNMILDAYFHTPGIREAAQSST
ncbi:MAG TPA: penicillin-binding protein 2 [Thermomicrobiales bacterium]|nr:penicillin-binding protein 2 [Thermomicrobiales bacterium]